MRERQDRPRDEEVERQVRADPKAGEVKPEAKPPAPGQSRETKATEDAAKESRERDQASRRLEAPSDPASSDPAHDLREGHGRPSASESPPASQPVPHGVQGQRAELVSHKPDRTITYREMMGYFMLYAGTMGSQNPVIEIRGNEITMPQRFMKFIQTMPVPEMPAEEPAPSPPAPGSA